MLDLMQQLRDEKDETLREFLNRIPQLLRMFPPEMVIKALPAEERLKGLSPEEILNAIPPECRAALKEKLKDAAPQSGGEKAN